MIARAGPVAIPIGGLMARVGLSTLAGLNRINRGPLRVVTEIPVRILYAALQLGFDPALTTLEEYDFWRFLKGRGKRRC